MAVGKHPQLYDMSGMSESLTKLAERVKPYVPIRSEFAIRCPKPGCRYTADGKTGPLRIQEVKLRPPTGGSRFYFNVRHYAGFKDGKREYDVHQIGKLTPAGIELYYAAPDTDHILHTIKAKAEAISAAEENRTKKAKPRLPAKVSAASPALETKIEVKPEVQPPAQQSQSTRPVPRPVVSASKQQPSQKPKPVKHQEQAVAAAHPRREGIAGVFDILGGYVDRDDLRKAGVTDTDLEQAIANGVVQKRFHFNKPILIYALTEDVKAIDANADNWRILMSARYNQSHKNRNAGMPESL
jgi:hypothetical protein